MDREFQPGGEMDVEFVEGETELSRPTPDYLADPRARVVDAGSRLREVVPEHRHRAMERFDSTILALALRCSIPSERSRLCNCCRRLRLLVGNVGMCAETRE